MLQKQLLQGTNNCLLQCINLVLLSTNQSATLFASLSGRLQCIATWQETHVLIGPSYHHVITCTKGKFKQHINTALLFSASCTGNVLLLNILLSYLVAYVRDIAAQGVKPSTWNVHAPKR